MTSEALHAWMWAHPTLFTVVTCGSFAAFGLGLFFGLKKLVGKSDDYA